MEHFSRHTNSLVQSGKPVVLTGDYNVIPTQKDAYKPDRWVEDALFRPESRAAFKALLDQGWIDALRHLYPEETLYTYWDYFRNAFGRNAGIRIDHFLLSPALKKRLKAAGVDRQVRGWEKTSDHAPVWIEI
jgi:exodeoxyribonuclease-3